MNKKKYGKIDPSKYGFFQFVRWFDCFSYKKNRKSARTGQGENLHKESIRFRQKPVLAFQDGEISDFGDEKDREKPSLYVNFLGLWGTNSPLPLVFTEYAFERSKHHGDDTLVRFTDIFHHRMLSLFYKAWAVNQPAVCADRDDNDHFREYLISLLGIKGLQEHEADCSVSVNSRLYYSGHLLHSSAGSSSLKAVLSDYFKVNVEIKPFIKEKLNIPKEEIFKLGMKRRNGELGRNIMIGKRFLSCSDRFRLVFGPMNLEKFKRLLPGTSGYKQLIDWVKSYVSDKYNFDVQLILNAEEISTAKLGCTCLLGQVSWISGGSELLTNNSVLIKNAG